MILNHEWDTVHAVSPSRELSEGLCRRLFHREKSDKYSDKYSKYYERRQTMGFSFDHISLGNLFENGHNYIVFSIMGMLIVFAGLSLISLYITLLPRILVLFRLQKKESHGKSSKPGNEETDREAEMLLAIAVALHLEQAGGSGYEKITWKRFEDRESAWLTAGRMRGLAVRSHLPDNRSQGRAQHEKI
jgi:Na+-transporting methylmalonyl-CoA/oxaloacetate decarboxylase gamma subunit